MWTTILREYFSRQQNWASFINAAQSIEYVIKFFYSEEIQKAVDSQPEFLLDFFFGDDNESEDNDRKKRETDENYDNPCDFTEKWISPDAVRSLDDNKMVYVVNNVTIHNKKYDTRIKEIICE